MLKDLSNQIFATWKVLDYHSSSNSGVRWNVECIKCGNHNTYLSSDLNRLKIGRCKACALTPTKACKACNKEYPRTSEYFRPVKAKTLDKLATICTPCSNKRNSKVESVQRKNKLVTQRSSILENLEVPKTFSQLCHICSLDEDKLSSHLRELILDERKVYSFTKEEVRYYSLRI